MALLNASGQDRTEEGDEPRRASSWHARPMTSVKQVIFDLGNVLVRWNPRNLYRQLFPDTDDGRAAMEQFLTEIVPLDTFNRRIDLGEDVFAVCEEVVTAHPTIDPFLIRAYATRQSEMWAGTIDGTVALHGALRSTGVPLYALSNWGRDFALAEETFPVLKDFDGRVVSHHVGVVKPDRAIFDVLLSQFNLRADECLFIDDSTNNIAAAEALGFRTHHFTHPIRLAALLDDLGLVPIPVSRAWTIGSNTLTRTTRFADFDQAWAFMSLVAESAEQLGHHPDWSNRWNTVEISLTTHDRGNTVTSLDRALASSIDEAARVIIAD
jgi:2-haloacid dehalogenase